MGASRLPYLQQPDAPALAYCMHQNQQEQSSAKEKMMRRSLRAAAAILSLLFLIGCSSATVRYGHTHRGVKHRKAARTERRPLGIPPGHLPSPGHCRIWFPGLPPGQQPPPGNCRKLARNIPQGAWLLYRPVDEPGHVDVSVYDDNRPGVIVEVRIFEAETGAFLRIRT